MLDANLTLFNANYIPPGRVGPRVGSAMLRIGSARLFRYQHVVSPTQMVALGVIPNARLQCKHVKLAFWSNIGIDITFFIIVGEVEGLRGYSGCDSGDQFLRALKLHKEKKTLFACS